MADIVPYPIHPLADIFPPLTETEFDSLVADIKATGQRQPITLYKDMVIDGRHRQKALVQLGKQPRYTEHTGDPVAEVVSLNLRRRHLTDGQRAAVGHKLVTATVGGMRWKSHSADWRNEITQEQAAKMANTSGRSIQRMGAVAKASEALTQAVESVEVTLDDAYGCRKEDEATIAKGLDAVKAAEKPTTLRREITRMKRASQVAALRDNPPKLPDGQYRTLVIDPPWPIQKVEREVRPNQTKELDYPVMTLDAIRDLSISDMLADDAWVFLWTTQRFLPDAIHILNEWDLWYRFEMVWHKPGGFQVVGLPQFNHEMVLCASKGSPQFADLKAFKTCNAWARGDHSVKPDAFYELIERVTFAPRLDMYARRPRDGWDAYGDEVSS